VKLCASIGGRELPVRYHSGIVSAFDTKGTQASHLIDIFDSIC
jgi:hypothetical protein